MFVFTFLKHIYIFIKIRFCSCIFIPSKDKQTSNINDSIIIDKNIADNKDKDSFTNTELNKICIQTPLFSTRAYEVVTPECINLYRISIEKNTAYDFLHSRNKHVKSPVNDKTRHVSANTSNMSFTYNRLCNTDNYNKNSSNNKIYDKRFISISDNGKG